MFKELEIMKALRYLLIAVILSTASLLSVANTTAQSLAQLPDNEMRSTSVLPTSGSTLPQAAVEGTTTTYDEENSSPKHHGNIRRWGGSEGEPSNRPEPWEDPIGDAGWTLLALAAAYAVLRVYRRKRVNGGRTA
jgi:hypothetical protein